ncbi:transcription factor EMB1444-like isoform X2 [Olea europaea var. sylvestris]|uniref:transcription factor EMB1444-like isoform X2 n=1 Tax=Olea europaea var. sylvestris TaxID=158386 RepID=UPI000C1D2376|nr:transcription factor EMB1444-like isoform X2 [Olea europaea var. sylvestris]
MGSHLGQVLRSLCFNTGWKYAVFWKLKHRSRMMLTCEDAYYDNNQYSERKWFNEIVSSMHDGPFSHDPLGLAVAKMSYPAYSLGEGIVGQVAVSGKHSWIFLDKHVADSPSMSECFDGWQDQFSAGIKTIAVVAVIPYGVIQLGSLHKIAEDLKLVSHIRCVFSTLHDSLAGFVPQSRQSSMENSCPSDICTRTSGSTGFHGSSMTIMDRCLREDEMNLWSQIFPSLGKPRNHSYFFPPPRSFSNRSVKLNMLEEDKYSIPGFGESENSFPLGSENLINSEKQVETESFTETKCEGGTTDWRDSKNISAPFVKDTNNAGCNLYNTTLPTNNSDIDMPYFPSESLDPAACKDQAGVFCAPELSNMQLNQDLEKHLESITKSNQLDSRSTPMSFAADYELYEALGPAFWKQNTHCDKEAEQTGSEMAIEISEGMDSSNLLIANYDSEHLLDAVVGKISHDGDDIHSEKSMLTAEKTLETCKSDVGSISSAGYSFDRDSMNSFNSSATCGVQSSKGFSSTSSSRGSEYSERTREQVKITKKRARPGESCRPRPRDRQLIQDRIKELRELVPNGSKCSIDSLLERTIKHMLFMQSITTHAEKLKRCSASKLLDKDMGIGSSCNEQGSSWAVEVGNNPKACPIVVENINMNGQMLVKMICEEQSHFLEVAETIRSLGLIILKGATEAHGNKMWMCFVVENNRSMHRMDVLWSLMQLLQPEITN